nr:MAG TPA: hypothetical protein [Caudoviricetes sp.]
MFSMLLALVAVPPALAELPTALPDALPPPLIVTPLSHFRILRFNYSCVEVHARQRLAVPEDLRRIQAPHGFFAPHCEKGCSQTLVHQPNGRNRDDGVSWLAVKAPLVAFRPHPLDGGNDLDAVHLPVCRQPVPFIGAPYLHRLRVVTEHREIRRKNRTKLLQKRHILVRIAPNTFKLVIVAIKMDTFACSIFGRQGIVERYPFQLVNADVRFRLDDRDMELALTRENHLFGVFHRQNHGLSPLLSMPYFFFFFLETKPIHAPPCSTVTPNGFCASCINFARSLEVMPFRSNATLGPLLSQYVVWDGEEPSPLLYLFRSTPTCSFTKATTSLCVFLYLELSTTTAAFFASAAAILL